MALAAHDREVCVSADVVINEVSDKGSAPGEEPVQCGTEDWIELFNSADSDADISGYILHDDRGPSHAKAFVFPGSTILAAGSYTVFCCNAPPDSSTAPRFKIKSQDTLTLRAADTTTIVHTTGSLRGNGAVGKSFSRKSDGSGFDYTDVGFFTTIPPDCSENEPHLTSSAINIVAPTLPDVLRMRLISLLLLSINITDPNSRGSQCFHRRSGRMENTLGTGSAKCSRGRFLWYESRWSGGRGGRERERERERK